MSFEARADVSGPQHISVTVAKIGTGRQIYAMCWSLANAQQSSRRNNQSWHGPREGG